MKMHAVVISLIISLALPAALLAQPVIVIDPQTLEADLVTGEIEEFAITVANEGDEPLIWMSEIEFIAGGEEMGWLAVDPAEGVIEAGDDMDVIITMDATGLGGGQYEAEIRFFSNDPDSPITVVLVVIMVTPAPDIAVEWLEEVGFPQIIDFNRVGDIWIEAAYIVTVTVRNVGVETLYVAEINSDEEHFGADPVEFELEPGEEMVVEVIFQAEEEGLYEGTLTIISNDPDEEETIIQLRAEAFEPPEMLVNADSLSLEIEGNEAQAVLEISNTGQYELNWDATLVQVEGNLLDSTEAIFSVEPQSGAISPGAMQEVLIKAIFAIEGNFDLAFDLVINSNDPDLPEMVVDVRISGTNEVEELPAWALPESPILASIQPNPFNSSAILEFYLPSRSAATLKLFDLQGRERGVIFNGVLEAGFHQATIETGNLPAAIYLVQIKAGEEIRVVRAVVVK